MTSDGVVHAKRAHEDGDLLHPGCAAAGRDGYLYGMACSSSTECEKKNPSKRTLRVLLIDGPWSYS
jgi:hypothetical protein